MQLWHAARSTLVLLRLPPAPDLSADEINEMSFTDRWTKGARWCLGQQQERAMAWAQAVGLL
jgi:hypothetical protein